jgi:hypothetical protein
MNETLGWNFIMIGNLLRSYLASDQLQYLDTINPEQWYPADDLIAFVRGVEKDQGVEKVKSCGKAIFYTLKDKLEQMDINSPLKALKSIENIYLQNNRGPSMGGWRVVSATNCSAVLENATKIGCAFSEGVLIGAIKTFNGNHVLIKHLKCRDKGDDICLYEVTWTE